MAKIGGIQALVEALAMPVVIVNYALKTLLTLAASLKAAMTMVQSNIFEFGTNLLRRELSVELKESVINLFYAITSHGNIYISKI